MSLPPSLHLIERSLYTWKESVPTAMGALLLLAACMSAQVIYQRVSPGHVPTNEEQLKKYGIGISREEVISALASAKADIRAIAANQLTVKEDPEAIPLIRKAASIESNEVVRINMYGDLAELSDRAAVTWLENACFDQTMRGNLRILAAQDLWNVHNRQCLPSVLSVADSSEDEMERQEAIGLLANYFWRGKESPPEGVMAVLCSSLSDKSIVVRLQAADALARIGTKQQAACLETALVGEQADTVRQAMQEALSALKSKAGR